MTNKISRILIVLFTLIIGILLIIPMSSCNNNTQKQSAYDKYFSSQFHRGGRDSRPENTLYSYTYAIENGAAVIEGDMQLTKDGVIVMSHNPTLNANITQDETGNYVQPYSIDIRTLTYDELQKYNVGHINKNTEYYQTHGKTQIEHDAKIPTLEQLFELVQKSGNEEIMFSLESKLFPDPKTGTYNQNNVDAKLFAEKFNEIVTKYNMSDRVILQSFDWKILPIMKDLNPKIKTAGLWSETESEDQGIGTLWIGQSSPSPWLNGYNIADFNNDAVELAHKLNFDIVSPEFGQITQAQIDKAHEYGMQVVPWTINKIEDMETAWNMNVDGIISDKGWLLNEFLSSKNANIPNGHPFDSEYHLNDSAK